MLRWQPPNQPQHNKGASLSLKGRELISSGVTFGPGLPGRYSTLPTLIINPGLGLIAPTCPQIKSQIYWNWSYDSWYITSIICEVSWQYINVFQDTSNACRFSSDMGCFLIKGTTYPLLLQLPCCNQYCRNIVPYSGVTYALWHFKPRTTWFLFK